MKTRTTQQFLVTITHEKPIPDLCDRVAGRLWSLDGVVMVDAKSLPDETFDVLAAKMLDARVNELKSKVVFVGGDSEVRDMVGYRHPSDLRKPLVDMEACERIASEALGDLIDVVQPRTLIEMSGYLRSIPETPDEKLVREMSTPRVHSSSFEETSAVLHPMLVSEMQPAVDTGFCQPDAIHPDNL